jgi:hypothetical protein
MVNSGGARTSIWSDGERSDRHRQQRCALMKAKQRSPAPRGGPPIASAEPSTRRGQNLLPGPPENETFALAGGRIRGMSGRVA